MIKFIKRTNEWYESLTEMKGSIFYLSLVFVPYILIMLLAPSPYNRLALIWCLLVAIWRVSYSFLKNIK